MLVPATAEKPAGDTFGIHKWPSAALPANFTGLATVQFRQWANDFQFYYYQCASVNVVNEGTV